MIHVPIKKCIEEDFSKFWPMSTSEQLRLNTLRKNDNIYCIDWTNEALQLYGSEAKGDFSALDVAVIPCHMKETLIGREVDNIPTNCNRDQEELAKYLSNSYNLLTLYNTKDFQIDQFGVSKLKKKSAFFQNQLAPMMPTWVETFIEAWRLSDETNLIQFGGSDENYFHKVDHSK